MTSRCLILLALNNFLATAVIQSQPVISPRDSLGYHYASRLDTNRIKIDLKMLSSDAFMGRETAEKGQKLAAEFLADAFAQMGLSVLGSSSNYIQTYPLRRTAYESGSVILDEDTLKMLEDFYSFSGIVDSTVVFNDVVFLGYGIRDDKYDNYKGQDLKGKAGLIYSGEPMRGDISRISGTVMPTLWSDGYEAKLAVAEEQGLSALFIVQESFEKNLPRVIYYLKKPRLVLNLPQVESIPVIYVSKGMVPRIFNDYDSDALKKLLSSGQDIYGLSRNGVMKFNLKKSVLPVSASNVVGCVKGTDLASEYVFVSGHYDHLGMREGTIFYGADDNGSGTSSILEIARLFAEAKRNGHGPRRTIVFLLVSGEEKGLLGSEYYVEHPLVPLRETVVDLNVDMIGRSDKLYEDSIQDYIYLIGSNKLSNELHQVSEEVNNKFSKLLLDYRYNDPNDPQRLYYRSDHYNFAKHKIPVIFYFRGLHDDYHLPSDTYDKIEFSTIEKVSKLIFMTAWEIANRETRLLIDEEVD